MSNQSDRMVSLAEVREAMSRVYERDYSHQCHDEWVGIEPVIAELTKPRLKPDCPVLLDTGDYKDHLHCARDIDEFDSNIRPLVRADHVMQWVNDWYSTGYQNLHGETCAEYVARLIREETEVTK